MSKKLRYIFSISMVLILLTPLTVKLFDSTLHHHDRFVCTAKTVQHFHEFHKACPIPGFVLSFYSLNKTVHVNRELFYYEIITIDILINYCKNPGYSFALRAPPLHISF